MHDVVALACELVGVDSVNPAPAARGAGEAAAAPGRGGRGRGGAGEAAAAAFVVDWARRAGIEATLHEATPGRPSVVVRARGSGGGRTLLLCGHLDTVGYEGVRDPLLPRIAGDRLFGRGAYDM